MAFNVAGAKQAGYSDAEIMDYLSRKQAATPAPTDVAPHKTNALLDLLPLIGGVAGSFVPGLGTIVGGAAGAGLGALAKNLFDDKEGVDVGDIAKEALLSGAGGIAGKGLGFLASKALPGIGSLLGDVGENVALKSLRLNKGQLGGFLEKHGEDVTSFLSKEGAIGKNSAQLLEEHIQPLQDQFNSIAKTSGLKVNPDTFLQNVDDQAKRLIDAGGSENRDLADKLRAEALYVWQNDLAPAGYDISKADQLRRTFASKVNWNDPNKATVDYALADALRKTNIDTASQAGIPGLGELGVRLSKFRDLDKAITAQEQLGKGNLPAGITKWLALGAGLGAGGPVGGATGLAVNAIVNSPSVLRKAATGAINLGSKLETVPSLSPSAVNGLTKLGVAGGSLSGIDSSQPSAPGTGVPQQSGVDDILQPTATTASGMNAPTSEEEALRQVLASVMFSKAKTVNDIKTAYDFLKPAQKPLAAEQQKLKINADSGLRAIGTVKEILAKDPNAPLKSKLPIVQGRSPYAAAAKEVADVYTRIRTGAALNVNEQKFYDSQLPQPFDSPETIKYKLGLFENLFRQISTGQQSAIPDVTNTLFSSQ